MATRTADHDVKAAQAMILWARKNKVTVHQLTIGQVALVMTDEAPRGPAASSPSAPGSRRPPPENIFEEMGGEAWRRAQAEVKGDDPDVDEDDDPDADDDEPAPPRHRRR